MIINSIPNIKVTSMKDHQNIYNIVPNFMLVNQPIVKQLETKVKKQKRLVVWFDIRNEYDQHFDQTKLLATTILEEFKFQLVKIENGNSKSVKAINNKEIVEAKEAIIKKDWSMSNIDQSTVLVYELDDEKFDTSDLTFKYTLNYKNHQNVGLTYDGVNGKNEGLITIQNNHNNFVFNNAFAYLENSKHKVVVLNQDVLTVNNQQHINQINPVDNPLLELIVRNEVNNYEELTKSEQISTELRRITDEGINYLQTDKKQLKTIKKANKYLVYSQSGNHYDFQTDKWVNSDQDQTSYWTEENKLTFEYKGQKLAVDLAFNQSSPTIQRTKPTAKELTKLSSYKNVKPNTKFNTFIKARNRF